MKEDPDEEVIPKSPYISSECLKGYHGDCGVAACQDDCHGNELDEDDDDDIEIF